MSNDYSEMSYDVGKGKPPREHRFRPGRSGNPKGRPPKDRSPDHRMMNELLVAVASEPIKVRIGGEEREVTKRTAIAIGLINDALTGTPMQRIRAFQALEKAGAFNVLSSSIIPSEEARRRFLQTLADEFQESEQYRPGSTNDG